MDMVRTNDFRGWENGATYAGTEYILAQGLLFFGSPLSAMVWAVSYWGKQIAFPASYQSSMWN